MKKIKIILVIMITFSVQSLFAFETTPSDVTPEPTSTPTPEPTPTPTPTPSPIIVTPSTTSDLETDDKLNPELLNTLPAVNILNLSGKDADEEAIKRFAIQSLPDAEAGILYLADGRTEVRLGQVLSIEESDNIRFDPNENFEGNATFTYSSVARNGAVDNVYGTVTIPIVAEVVIDTPITPIVAGENNDTFCPLHEELCECTPYEKNIPTLSKFGVFAMFILSLFMGTFFMKKEL